MCAASEKNGWQKRKAAGSMPAAAGDLGPVVTRLCEQALQDARGRLHPLLGQAELSRLSQRGDFLDAFKAALEQRIARAVAARGPDIQAVFRYEEHSQDSGADWDGSIHLLVAVPQRSDVLRALGQELDRALLSCLRGLGWQHVCGRRSVLEIHQVTPPELRHGLGYAALFSAVYSAPVRVWPARAGDE